MFNSCLIQTSLNLSELEPAHNRTSLNMFRHWYRTEVGPIKTSATKAKNVDDDTNNINLKRTGI